MKSSIIILLILMLSCSASNQSEIRREDAHQIYKVDFDENIIEDVFVLYENEYGNINTEDVMILNFSYSDANPILRSAVLSSRELKFVNPEDLIRIWGYRRYNGVLIFVLGDVGSLGHIKSSPVEMSAMCGECGSMYTSVDHIMVSEYLVLSLSKRTEEPSAYMGDIFINNQ